MFNFKHNNFKDLENNENDSCETRYITDFEIINSKTGEVIYSLKTTDEIDYTFHSDKSLTIYIGDDEQELYFCGKNLIFKILKSKL